MKAARILTIGALVATIALTSACGEENEATNHQLHSEYNPPVSNQFEPEDRDTIEGKIIDVQHSSVAVDYYNNTWSHPIEYVFLEVDGQERLFIYPYSKGIRKDNALITYMPLPGGVISTDLFVRLFTEEGIYYGVDNSNLEGDGIIVKDGIQYIDDAR